MTASGRAGRSVVLCYHAVGETWTDLLAVPPQALREHVRHLLDEGLRPVRFSEAVTGTGDGVFSLTFDDAFRSVADRALPVLAELGVVATVFVPTAFPSSGQALSWPEFQAPARCTEPAELEPLSWRALRELADAGWEIGSHTRTHAHLPALSDRALRTELRGSMEECSQALGQACTTLAYPYGEVDERVRDAVADAGYTAAAALGPQWRRGDPLWWPRTGVYRQDSLPRFRAKTRPLAQQRWLGGAAAATRRVLRSA